MISSGRGTYWESEFERKSDVFNLVSPKINHPLVNFQPEGVCHHFVVLSPLSPRCPRAENPRTNDWLSTGVALREGEECVRIHHRGKCIMVKVIRLVGNCAMLVQSNRALLSAK